MDEKDLYPPGPEGVPRDLTAPTAAYKRNAWLAFAALLVFVALYVGLTAHLGWTAWRLVRDALLGGEALVGALLAIPVVFFFAFLVRGLFVVKRGQDDTLVEITEAEEPELIAFVRRVAKDTGAPAPHKVFLSARVNAAVFYDLSFFNLIFPSKKNLELGLGLIAALELDELKAVVAHEFGHFAQRTMAVGRWVYIAHQIAGHVVSSRGWFDTALAWLSAIDLRIAWIGWIMRLLVWAIRAVLDTAFRGILLAHRALTREMELQADLVAVSVSGSDSLIHALHKLGAADDAWGRAVRFAEREERKGQPVLDLFAVQERILEHLRVVLDDEALGRAPARPKIEREGHRVFETALAQPPRMWSTHPPNREREDNAKRRYFASTLDPRPAWALFTNAEATRHAVTDRLLTHALAGPDGVPVARKERAALDETLARVDEDFDRPVLDRRYRGAYLGRSIVSEARTLDDLYLPEPDADRDAILARLDALYPESLSDDLERWYELRDEHVLLQALADGILDAPGGTIQHRGREIRRAQLTEVIAGTRAERDAAETRVLAHDREVRTAHRLAARHLDPDWEGYLVGLAELLHYADHAAANVQDALGHLHHVFTIVIADGRVSSSERARLLAAARDLHGAMETVFAQRGEVVLPAAVAETLEKDTWEDVLAGPFDLAQPAEHNLGDWLNAVDSWGQGTAGALGALNAAALEELLEAEDYVARCLREGLTPKDAPERAWVPQRYTTLVTGEERERQKKLGWWDRFQLADGWLPGTARLAVASSLLLPALFFSGFAGDTTVHVYNGLGRTIEVEVGDDTAILGPHSSAVLSPAAADAIVVRARTEDGHEIERFEADASSAWASYVYDVAGATPMVEWTAVYSAAGGRDLPERPLGAPRWMHTDADAIFRDPPRSVSVSSRSGSATRDVITAIDGFSPSSLLARVEGEVAQRGLIEAHVRWDAVTDPWLSEWLHLGRQHGAEETVRARIARGDGDVVFFGRLEMDLAEGPDARAAICARFTEDARRAPDDPDRAYLATRCLPDDAQGAAYLEGHARHPSHPWFAFAAGYEHATRAEWAEAERLLRASRTGPTASLWLGTAIELARIRRAGMSSPRLAGIAELASPGSPLEMLMMLDGLSRAPHAAVDLQVRAFRALASGDLPGAIEHARLAPDDSRIEPMVRRLVAASEGATPAMIEDVFAYGEGPGGWDGFSVFAMTALAMREGRDATSLIAALREQVGDRADVLLSLLDPDRLATEPEWVDAQLARLLPAMRGQALTMAIVLLGERAPAEWRTSARALLFDCERPYFR